ncbi:hypothetical protein LIER_26798 [Lithospermum erythrorhizon]|uniref:Uncharacterized protein n=1 Tax=Lithospermum erythrorhizon TaxID=34254 RepID=A0AAV3RCW9_LITER
MIATGHYADDQVQLAVGQCPRNCIHYVTPLQRIILEELLGSFPLLSPSVTGPSSTSHIPLLFGSSSAFFERLYSALGAEVTVGGLRFTPFHDPFANMEIPQAVVDDLCRAVHDDPSAEPDLTAPGSAFPVATSSATNPPTARTEGTSSQPAEKASDDILQAAKECPEPPEVPFSAMAGVRRPIFRKVRVKKVLVSSEAGSMAAPPDLPTSTGPSTKAKKRPDRDEDRPMVFGTRKKHIAHRPKRIETITISEDPPSSSPPAPAVPPQEPNPSPAPVPQAPLDPSSSVPQEADSQAASPP